MAAINFDAVRKEMSTEEFAQQMEKADHVAKVLVNHLTNKDGQILAKVEENPGF